MAPLLEETIKICPEDCEDLIDKDLPTLIESANSGDIGAQYRLWDIWRSCLDSIPAREPPLALVQFFDRYFVKMVQQNKKPHQVLDFFSKLNPGRGKSMDDMESEKERDFMVIGLMEMLRKEHTYEVSVEKAEEILSENCTGGVSKAAIERIYNKHLKSRSNESGDILFGDCDSL